MTLAPQARERGMSLVEVMVSAAILAIFLGSLFVLNASSMQTLKMTREAAASSQVLQQRVESLRIANWQLITQSNCTWLQSNAFMVDANGDGIPDADGSELLKGESETLTLEPYGSTTATPTPAPIPTKLSRIRGSSAVVLSNNAALLQENAVKATWTISYTGSPNDRSISQKMVAILAKGGVAK